MDCWKTPCHCANALWTFSCAMVFFLLMLVGLAIWKDDNSLQTLSLGWANHPCQVAGCATDPTPTSTQRSPAWQPNPGGSAQNFITDPNRPKVPGTIKYCRGAYNESTAAGLHTVERGRLRWSPHKDRFMVPFCQMGQYTNRLICHSKYMVISALLNRTLVWPEHDEQYNYGKTLDFPHLLKCLTPDHGNSSSNPVIISLEDYLQQSSSENLTIRCLQSNCGWRSTMYERFDYYGLAHHEEGDLNWDVKYDARIALEALYEYYSQFTDTRTLAIGDIYGINLEATQGDKNTAKGLVMGFWTDTGKTNTWDFLTWPGLKGSIGDCSPLIRPHAAIMTAAKRFVRLFIGSSSFVSVHIRHGDFLDFGRQLVGIPILMKDDMVAAQYWNKGLEEEFGEDWSTDPQILAMLDKAVCTLSTIFLATARSTFSQDILRLRRGFGNVHCNDGDPCASL